ncbi:MAG TPA: SDR family oxidoreductase [Bryobacteraceae bacterium]|nr:SDR family oxidoreductase [Bryobacteraceae bacterium]
MNPLLEGKVAVITGGSSGIGRAAALAFAREGAHVAIGARRQTEGEETTRMVRETGGQAVFVQTDVSQTEQVQRLIQAAVERWGRLDCAFNNAGIEGDAFVHTADYPETTWDQIVAINLTGVFLSMKYELQQMLKHGSGTIVNMSSIAGLVGGAIGSPYFATKHGVIGLTKAAAMEYAKSGIRVNAICPAVIDTDMAQRGFSEMWDAVVNMHPVGRVGKPEEVADAVVWLCSDRAAFITGHALPVDGGWVAQ